MARGLEPTTNLTTSYLLLVGIYYMLGVAKVVVVIIVNNSPLL